MRPGRSTSVISATTKPAPELASMPRWVRCQSEATPSLALYWHMGDTTMRLASVRSASLIGEKSALMFVWRLLGDLSGDDVGLRWRAIIGIAASGRQALSRRNQIARRRSGATGRMGSWVRIWART